MDHYLFQNREAQKELLASNDDLSDNNITKVSDLKKQKKNNFYGKSLHLQLLLKPVTNQVL